MDKFDERLAVELEERIELGDWSASASTTTPIKRGGPVTVTVGVGYRF